MENESVDTVVSMNGFHAFPDKQKAFHEIWRVLKPGGRLMVLEFSKPNALMRPFYDFYSFKVMPSTYSMTMYCNLSVTETS